MSLLCYFGRHSVSVASISLRPGGGYKGLCEACALPVEREDKGKWREARPLYLDPRAKPATSGADHPLG